MPMNLPPPAPTIPVNPAPRPKPPRHQFPPLIDVVRSRADYRICPRCHGTGQLMTVSGRMLRALRRSMGLTGTEFGKAIGVGLQHISNVERGKVPASQWLVDQYMRMADPDASSGEYGIGPGGEGGDDE